MRFKKKPVEIDAEQFDGTYLCAWEIADKLDIYQDAFSFTNDKFVCHNLEGQEIGIAGDWIIKKEDGCLAVCNPDVFELTYESVAEEIDHDHDCKMCGKPMIEVDFNSWLCPDYPHNTQERYKCFIKQRHNEEFYKR